MVLFVSYQEFPLFTNLLKLKKKYPDNCHTFGNFPGKIEGGGPDSANLVDEVPGVLVLQNLLGFDDATKIGGQELIH